MSAHESCRAHEAELRHQLALTDETVNAYADEAKTLRAQRDALVEACKLAVAAETALFQAARAVMACREDGTFGPDGEQGFKMLAEAIANAEGSR